MTVGATSGTMSFVVWDVTAGAAVCTIYQTSSINNSGECLFNGSFNETAVHTYELRVQIATTGNISLSAGYFSIVTNYKFDSLSCNGSGTNQTLYGITFLGKQVYRYYLQGTFPSVGTTVDLINPASNLIRYEGGVVRFGTSQMHDIHLIGIDTTTTSYISPVSFNGVFNTAGGSIRLYNNAADSSYNNQTCWVMIEYTTA